LSPKGVPANQIVSLKRNRCRPGIFMACSIVSFSKVPVYLEFFRSPLFIVISTLCLIEYMVGASFTPSVSLSEEEVKKIIND